MKTVNIEQSPIKIADGIFWVGYSDEDRGLHCNPYLIIEGKEAVLIDGGNRDDFSNVMLKILQTGLEPSQISNLIYQHYDPDLCGSLPQLEAIINNKSLSIISHSENNTFIRYYSDKTKMLDFRDINNQYVFETGRRLDFYATPYCHQPGSFVTYDSKTKTMFSSDLFGSFDEIWSLYLDINNICRDCSDYSSCPLGQSSCKMSGIIKFHQKTMPSNLAFTYALDIIDKIDVEIIAPQHGSIITSKEDINAIKNHLRKIENVGIDYLLKEHLE